MRRFPQPCPAPSPVSVSASLHANIHRPSVHPSASSWCLLSVKAGRRRGWGGLNPSPAWQRPGPKGPSANQLGAAALSALPRRPAGSAARSPPGLSPFGWDRAISLAADLESSSLFPHGTGPTHRARPCRQPRGGSWGFPGLTPTVRIFNRNPQLHIHQIYLVRGSENISSPVSASWMASTRPWGRAGINNELMHLIHVSSFRSF